MPFYQTSTISTQMTKCIKGKQDTTSPMKQSLNKCQCHQQGPLVGKEEKIQQLVKQVNLGDVPDLGGSQCFLGPKIKMVFVVS